VALFLLVNFLQFMWQILLTQSRTKCMFT